jgi:hypothetical protein
MKRADGAILVLAIAARNAMAEVGRLTFQAASLREARESRAHDRRMRRRSWVIIAMPAGGHAAAEHSERIERDMG